MPSTTARTERNTNGRRLRVAAWYSHRNIGPENMDGTFGSGAVWTAAHYGARVAECRMNGAGFPFGVSGVASGRWPGFP